MITSILIGALCFVVMIITHEWGHWIVFKLNKVPYKFTFNKEHIGFDFYEKDEDILFWIYAIAILIGFYPLFFIPINNIYVELCVMGCYLWGIGYDVKEIIKLVKK